MFSNSSKFLKKKCSNYELSSNETNNRRKNSLIMCLFIIYDPSHGSGKCYKNRNFYETRIFSCDLLWRTSFMSLLVPCLDDLRVRVRFRVQGFAISHILASLGVPCFSVLCPALHACLL